MRKEGFSLRAAGLLLGVSIFAISGPAFAQDTGGQQQAPGEDDDDAEEEGNIVVTGIRAAIENATEDKRNADQIKDVIDAEDIGKLPDTNVAEALQRVTGVQISRELGEGSEIAVRGFSQNRVEINGQTQIGGSSDGGVQFRDIPSDAFKSIEVIKTPTARDVEGALGAIVRFNTRRPLDTRYDVLSIKTSAQYAERAERWSHNSNIYASKQWDVGGDGRFGFNANLTHNTRRLRQDNFFIRGWEAVSNTGLDIDGDGVANESVEREPGTNIITDLQDGLYLPQQTILRLREQDRKLWSGTVSLQYMPNPDLSFYVDARYTDNRSQDEQYQYNSAFNTMLTGGATNRQLRNGMISNPVISDNQTLVSGLLGSRNNSGGPARGVNLVFLNSTDPFTSQVFTINGGVEWDVTDQLTVDVNYAYGDGSFDNDQAFITSVINFSEWPFYFVNFGADSDVPTLIPLVRNDPQANGAAPTEFREDLRLNPLDLGTYSVALADFISQRQSSRERTAKIDFEYDTGDGFISSIEFGGRLSSLRGQRNRLFGRDTSGNNADGDLAGTTFNDIDGRFPGLVVQQPFNNVLDGATGDIVREWFALNSDFLRLNRDEFLQTIGVTPVPDQNFGYDVERETQAAYLMANYGFDLGRVEFFGNLGMRYANTNQIATGGVDVGNNTFIPQTVEQNYDDWLPSFNLIGNFGNGFYFRFGAAEVLSRPNLTVVAPQIQVNLGSGTGFGGNPNLLPEEVFQLDLSTEYYWGSGNLISVALFYKDFSERIEGGNVPFCASLPPDEPDDPNDACDPGQNEILLNTQVNQGQAEVKGIELAWQQSLDFLPSPFDGFGFIANYTYIDADRGSTSASGLVLPLQKLSKNSYNLIGYYEKNGFSARAAYNWRSTFFDNQAGFQEASFRQSYGQMDASIGYDFTKKFSIQVEALNILNEPEIEFQELRERPLGYAVNDRRFLIGVHWRM